MRKKLDTRFPAARIKKIMQADEEVGKIAMATPVLISKALELFLQDLCDRTYEITLKRGAKTMNSHHLKECVRSHSVFDFLRDIVSRVPDLDSEIGGETGRRRKVAAGDNDDSCEEDVKRSKADSQMIPSSRGRGRGRGVGRKGNNEKSRVVESEKFEDHDTVSSPQLSDECETSPKSPAADTKIHEGETSGASKETVENKSCPKDFDLNMELDENGEVAVVRKEAEEESLSHSQWMGTGIEGFSTEVLPSQLHDDKNVLQPEEDYDCEDEL